jgi:hypothetical protein
MADDLKTAPAAAAPAAKPAIDRVQVVQEVSWIGARLREKSTYAGLTVVVALLLPFLAKLVPSLATANAASIVDYLSMIGIGIGGLIAIALPEKGARVVGMLLLAIGLSVLMSLSPANAAKLKLPIPIPLPQPAAAAPAATTPAAPAPAAISADPLADLMKDIENIDANTVAGVISDITLANADASTIITPAIAATATTPAIAQVVKDPISAACYPAAIQFIQSLPTATPPTGKFVLVQLFQKKRDFISQLQAGLPTYLKLGCAPLLGDEITTFINLLAMVGVKVLPAAATALMPALAPITLPALALTP